MYDQFPRELKELPQWVVVDMRLRTTARGEQVPCKEPLNPRTLRRASVTDASTWGTFAEAVAARTEYAPHIGFVFTDSDPYCFIDLDPPADDAQAARHQAIYKAFDSYTELSQSGRGVHIICRGRLPNGTRRDKVEVYSSERYAICTGNVIRPEPIVDYSELLLRLYNEMQVGASRTTALEDVAAVQSDDELFARACNAVNGDKFASLCRGEWQLDYPSQSEADFALLSIIAFYTASNEQARRMFRATALGQRDKSQHNDKYIDRALAKVRAEPQVDLSGLRLNITAAPAAAQHSSAAPDPVVAPPPNKGTPAHARAGAYTAPEDRLQYPPGFLGEICRYMEAQAIRPVREIAICAGIAWTAGVLGRSYNISGTGLNQYLVIVAPTGTGKEAAASGINKLFHAIRTAVPAYDNFIGPGVFASGPALVRVLDAKPCFISVLGEFGLTLKSWSETNTNTTVSMIRRVLLDLYTKSGHGQLLLPTVYSDKDKNTAIVESPCVTLLGEATPESFFDNLTEGQVSEGLISRFSIVEYTGDRPDRNDAHGVAPAAEVASRCAELAGIGLYTMNNNTVCNVPVQDDAAALFNGFDIECDIAIRSGSEVVRQLWNRGHLKALKMAGLIAACDNPHDPRVTLEHANWAVDFIRREIVGVVGRFARSETGHGETRSEPALRQAVDDYFSMTDAQRKNYKVPENLRDKQVVPYAFLRRRMRSWTHIVNDKRGIAAAIQIAIKDLVDAEILVQVPKMQAVTAYNTNSPLYVKGPSW